MIPVSHQKWLEQVCLSVRMEFRLVKICLFQKDKSSFYTIYVRYFHDENEIHDDFDSVRECLQ